MNPIEKARTSEILFYLYFNKQKEETLQDLNFWKFLESFCKVYNINYLAVINSMRTLLKPENAPTDLEIKYLLSKLGVTVRPLSKISGIYWQKQKKLDEIITISGAPTITSKLTDPLHKNAVIAFITYFYQVSGVFRYLDYNIVEEVLKND